MAIGYIQKQKAIAPDKPFFVYFATAPRTRRITGRRMIAKYQGHSITGWDTLREATFARQKAPRRGTAGLRALQGLRDMLRRGTMATALRRCSRARWRSTPVPRVFANHHWPA